MTYDTPVGDGKRHDLVKLHETTRARIRVVRRKNKKTQAQLAKDINVHRRTVENVEHGTNRRVNPEVLRRIANVLGMDAQELIDGRMAGQQ